MRNPHPRTSARTATLTAVCLLLALAPGGAGAQEAETLPEAVDFERLAPELRDRIERPPEVDPDLADTAIILTNVGNVRAMARCWAFDGDGKAIGRVRVKVPALGLRWILASDLSNGVDFIGSAHCFVSSPMKGTAVFLGPGLTDLPAGPIPQLLLSAGGHRVVFPVVAHY